MDRLFDRTRPTETDLSRLGVGTLEHPAYAVIADEMAAAHKSPGDPLVQSLPEARWTNRTFYQWVQGVVPGLVETFALSVPGFSDGIRLRVHRNHREARSPTIIYFHGGGYVLNGLDTHDRLMRELAIESGATVCGVQYSLAPERAWPFQLQEALHVLKWLRRNGATYGLDPEQLVLAGDSAGAHLALSTALAGRAEGVRPKLLLLAYGMYAYRFDTESHRKFGEGPGLTSARMRWFWDKAFPRPNAPFAQPLDAILEDLPAIHVIAAGRDCLRDDSRELAMRLRLAGVEVIYREYDGVRHSFLQFSRFLPAAHAAITNWSATLRKHCQVTGDTRT